MVGIHIKAADGVSRRSISIVVTRKGCDPATFYHKGTCHDHCPTYHYEQRFNWRCRACNRHCEFCEHWHHCVRCQRNTTVYKYVQRDDGTCQQRRVHAYRVCFGSTPWGGGGVSTQIVAKLDPQATNWRYGQMACLKLSPVGHAARALGGTMR